MKYILITGAAKNIGRETALILAKEKRNMILQYNKSKEEAFQLKCEIEKKYESKVLLFQSDFNKKTSLDKFIDEIKNMNGVFIEGIINSAAYYKIGDLINESRETFEKIFQVNFFSIFSIIQAFYRDLKANKGFIINLGMCGINRKSAEIYAAAFQISKNALYDLTKSFAKSFLKDEISVNMISPGYTETSVDSPKDKNKLFQKRVLTNIEVAKCILYLMSEPYITGQNIEIAGGIRL